MRVGEDLEGKELTRPTDEGMSIAKAEISDKARIGDRAGREDKRAVMRDSRATPAHKTNRDDAAQGSATPS